MALPSTTHASVREPAEVPMRAVVVLGAAVRRDAAGELYGALRRRARAAARVHADQRAGANGREPLLIATGGRAWSGCIEANALREALVADGVPEARIVRELCSLSTRENALFTTRLLALRGVHHAIVVTCAWHMQRALALFTRAGLDVRGVAAEGPEVSVITRVSRLFHERMSARVDGLARGWRTEPLRMLEDERDTRD